MGGRVFLEKAVNRKVPRFYYVEYPTDTWQKIVCGAKFIDLRLAVEPICDIHIGDMLVVGDESNPYPRAICKITWSKQFPSFKQAFDGVQTTGLGYIRAERLMASYHDYADDYALNEVKKLGVIAFRWNLLSCEYMKVTDETDYKVVRRAMAESGVTPFDPVYHPDEERDDYVPDADPTSNRGRQHRMSETDELEMFMSEHEAIEEQRQAVKEGREFPVRPEASPGTTPVEELQPEATSEVAPVEEPAGEPSSEPASVEEQPVTEEQSVGQPVAEGQPVIKGVTDSCSALDDSDLRSGEDAEQEPVLEAVSL